MSKHSSTINTTLEYVLNETPQPVAKFGVKRLNPDAKIPTKANPNDAGFDLYADADAYVRPGEVVIVPTGIALEMSPGWEAQIRPRSGNAAKFGVSVVNSPGTIDADYRGEIKVILTSLYLTSFKKGDRIAQIVFKQVPFVELVETDSLSDTERGAGGFGSTGA